MPAGIAREELLEFVYNLRLVDGIHEWTVLQMIRTKRVKGMMRQLRCNFWLVVMLSIVEMRAP